MHKIIIPNANIVIFSVIHMPVITKEMMNTMVKNMNKMRFDEICYKEIF